MDRYLIDMQNIAKSYVSGQSTVQALKAINLQVSAGEFVAMQGPSGSGKSTLLNICGLIDNANHGSYLFEGRQVHDLTASDLTRIRRETIGFIFQTFNLIPVMSIFDNIEYALLLNGISSSQRKQRVEELLTEVGLETFKHQRPDHISGGQRQRVAVARALVKRPRLVIADEPTANLDTETATAMIELMRNMAQRYEITFLIATHDERMSKRCDRVLQLQDGVLL